MSYIQRNFVAFVKQFRRTKRNTYNLGYKLVAAELYWESGEGWTARELADHLNIPVATLKYWLRQYANNILSYENAIAVSHRGLTHAA
jgi:hypothetical protein